MKRKVFCYLLLLFSFSVLSTAQTTNLKGTVKDQSDGQAMPGVSVFVKGTTIGTVTSSDGTYSLMVPDDASIIVFSFIGMQNQEFAYKGQKVINVQLQKEAVDVEEVVVTAMGIKRSEKSLGYAATSVSSDELSKARNTNVATSLSGKVAGVQVQTTSSDPGAASSVVIRGFGSINGNNQPLYIIDGVPLQSTTINTSGHSITAGGLSNVSANDIESMTVLKGAAATALYGSRASNGVIVINTKQGSKDKNKNYTIQYNGGLQRYCISFICISIGRHDAIIISIRI